MQITLHLTTAEIENKWVCGFKCFYQCSTVCFLHNGSKSSYSNKSPSGRVMASNAGGPAFSLRQGKHWFFLKKHKKTTTILRALWKIDSCQISSLVKYRQNKLTMNLQIPDNRRVMHIGNGRIQNGLIRKIQMTLPLQDRRTVVSLSALRR